MSLNLTSASDRTEELTNETIFEKLINDKADKYKKITNLAKNGMVYLAEDANKKTVVIKQVSNRSQTEINILRNLSLEKNDFIIVFLDSLCSENNNIIVTEYLNDYIDLHECRDTLENKDLYLTLFTQLTYGLKFIHDRNIVHRDIKPHNVLINLNTYHIKYIDFGLSCYKEKNVKNVENFVGTYNYMDPELLTESLTWNSLKNSDIYSLGCLFSFIYHRHVPFSSFYFRCLKVYKTYGNYDHKYRTEIIPIAYYDDIMLSIRDLKTVFKSYAKFYNFPSIARKYPEMKRMVAYFSKEMKINMMNMLGENCLRQYPF
jgi:serine/threonine protein kinase